VRSFKFYFSDRIHFMLYVCQGCFTTDPHLGEVLRYTISIYLYLYLRLLYLLSSVHSTYILYIRCDEQYYHYHSSYVRLRVQFLLA
jgi:hypothetical protein